MIQFDHVSKSWKKGVYTLLDLTLEVKKGETLVILGKSGGGKTTALKLINRLLDPTAGKITIDGNDIQDLDPIELRRGIGYAVQETGLFPHMTIEENIAIVPKLLKWDEVKIKARVEQLMEMMGLSPEVHCKRYPHFLSGGQRQRVGVARALAADPSIILMDEPFGALDPITREQTQNEFLELEGQINKTVIFVTHDLFEAVKLGDRIAFIDQGRLVELTTPQRFVETPPTVIADEFLGQHRFQLTLLTQTISDCIDLKKKGSFSSFPRLDRNTTLIEALNTFKDLSVDTLPVYQRADFCGVVDKTRLLNRIIEVLIEQSQVARR